MEKSKTYCAKRKKSFTKVYILYNFIYLQFWKRQDDSHIKRTKSLELKEGINYRGEEENFEDLWKKNLKPIKLYL